MYQQGLKALKLKKSQKNNQMKINITDVFVPSENQVKANIHGTVNLEIVDDNGTTITKLSGICVRKNTKDGTFFLAPPSYMHEKNGEKKYNNHFSLFPFKQGDGNDTYNKGQKDALNTLTADVVRVLSKGGTSNKSSAAKTPPPAASTPAKSNEPWG